MQTGEHPGRAQLAHAEGTALIVGLSVTARHLLQGIAGIAAVVVAADGVDVVTLAEYITAVDLLGASRDDNAVAAAAAAATATTAASAAICDRRHRGGSGRNGHRGRCHPAMASARDSQGGRERDREREEGESDVLDVHRPCFLSLTPAGSVDSLFLRLSCYCFFFLLFSLTSRERTRGRPRRFFDPHEARGARNIVLSTRSHARLHARKQNTRSRSPKLTRLADPRRARERLGRAPGNARGTVCVCVRARTLTSGRKGKRSFTLAPSCEPRSVRGPTRARGLRMYECARD